MSIKERQEKKWKYFFPILGLHEYEKQGNLCDGEKGVNRIIRTAKSFGQIAYTELFLAGLFAYALSAKLTHSRNPTEIIQKLKEDNKRQEARDIYENTLINKLYKNPGYIDKNHDKILSLEEQVEFRKKAGITPIINPPIGPNDYAMEGPGQFFLEPVELDGLERAVQAYETEAQTNR